MQSRPRPPIYFPNPQDGLIDISTISKEIESISKQTSVPRDRFKLVVSIVANFAANVAINAVLKSVERSVDKYEDLTESLFAFSSTLDAEAKFGNTALPLVICYGGKGGNNTVLGKRDDYTKKSTQELVEKGKQLPLHLDVKASFVYIGDTLPDLENPKLYNVGGIQKGTS